MASDSVSANARREREWYIVSRWQEYEGEGRANLLRIIGVAAFYGVELINYHGLNLGVLEMPPVVNQAFHLAITLLTAAWTMLALAVLACRRNGIFPTWLKFASTCGDLVLLTSALVLADGPRSPLIVGYLLIIALATLRFSLELIWFATAGAVAGYVFLLGFARWGEVPGWPQRDLSVPRYHQAIFLLALVLLGVILGQVIRRARRLGEPLTRRGDSQGGRG